MGAQRSEKKDRQQVEWNELQQGNEHKSSGKSGKERRKERQRRPSKARKVQRDTLLKPGKDSLELSMQWEQRGS